MNLTKPLLRCLVIKYKKEEESEERRKHFLSISRGKKPFNFTSSSSYHSCSCSKNHNTNLLKFMIGF